MHTGIYWQAAYWFSTVILVAVAGLLVSRGLLRQFSFFWAMWS